MTFMNPLRILTLDDDQDIRATLVEYFALYHRWIAQSAQDPDQALALIRQIRFDAVTTDINHPGINGLEFTQIVRDQGGPPVIIISGYNLPGGCGPAFACGARAYLIKPFRFDRLAEIIKLVVLRGVLYIGEG